MLRPLLPSMAGPLESRKPSGLLPRRCASRKVVCQNPAENPAVHLRKPALERGYLFPGGPLLWFISSEQYPHARLVGGLSVLLAQCDQECVGLDSIGDATADLLVTWDISVNSISLSVKGGMGQMRFQNM